MARNPFEAGSEYRPSNKQDGLKSNPDWSSDSAGPKSKKNPFSGGNEYRPGCCDDKPGSTRWPMGEGSVNVIKKPSS